MPLILRTNPGDWITIRHSLTGQVIRVKGRIRQTEYGESVELIFDDAPHNFQVIRRNAESLERKGVVA